MESGIFILILIGIACYMNFLRIRLRRINTTKTAVPHQSFKQTKSFDIKTECRNDARIKGKIFENEIKDKLFSLSDSYNVFNDVYLCVNTRSVQIDHIIISPYGVFVIETKNYRGYIYGTDDSEYWTKYVNEKEYKFRNPLKQNYSHVYSLQCILGLPRNYFIPIVVFSQNATIKCETNEFVIYANQLQSVIHSFRTQILEPNAIQTMLYVLNNAILLNKDRQTNHINSINQYIKEKNDLINQGICPRCKGALVERNGKYGKFIGCSNYPYCTFSKDI